MAEAYVQGAPDSTGKKIRNAADDRVQADGTIATVQTQLVRLCEEDRELLKLLNLTVKRQLAATIILANYLSPRGKDVSFDDVIGLADSY